MAEGNRKPQPEEIDPRLIEQMLEIEMIQKRAAWKQAKARRGGLRAFSFFFLFAVIVAALVGYFLFLSPERVGEMKSSRPSEVEPSPTPEGTSR